MGQGLQSGLFSEEILNTRWNPAERERASDLLTRLLAGEIDQTRWMFGEWRVWDSDEMKEAAGIYIPNAPWLRQDVASLTGRYSRPPAKQAHVPFILFLDIDWDIAADGTRTRVPFQEQIRRVIASGLPFPTWACMTGDPRDGSAYIQGKSIQMAWVGVGSIKEFEGAAHLLARKLGGDPAAKIRAHLFRLPGAEWVSDDRQTRRRQTVLFLNEGQTRPHEWKGLGDILARLPDLPTAPILHTPGSRSRVANGATRTRAAKNGKRAEPLDPEIAIPGSGVTARSLAQQIGEGNKAPIRCPFHDDATPSAVLFASANDSISIYCSSCAQTWRVGSPGVFSSGAPERIGPKVKGSKQRKMEKSPFYYTDQRYEKNLGAFWFSMGHTVYLKAPRESGKTHSTIEAVRDFITSERGDVIWLLHRRALVSQTVRRLKAAGVPAIDYRSIKGKIIPDPESPRVIVICLDSVRRIQLWVADGFHRIGDQYHLGQPVKWGALVIDEAEQVWRHLVGSTIGSDYDQTYEHLRLLVRNAQGVVVADADLGRLTLRVLRRMRGIPLEDFVERSASLIVSERYPSRSAQIYDSAEALDIILRGPEGLGSAGAVAVHCSSKIEAKRVAKLSAKMGRNPVLVCSDTVGEPEVVEFLDDPNAWLNSHPDRDLVYSPSMGSGVDIRGPKFRRFFAYIDPASGPGVYDHMQALDRVRAPVDPVRHIFIGGKTLCLPVDPERIKELAMMQTNLEARTIGAAAIPGTRHFERGEHLVAVPSHPEAFEAWADILAHKNRCRNDQRTDMLHLMAEAHWKVTYAVNPSEDEADEARLAAESSRKSIRREKTERVLNAASDMPTEQAEEILHGHAVATEAETERALRAELRDLAPSQVPGDRQVKSHLRGKLRGMIARYAIVRAFLEKDKRTIETIKADSFHHLGDTGARPSIAAGALLSLIVGGKAPEAEVRECARRLRKLGLAVGNPETASVNEILGMAWAQIGINRVRSRCLSTPSNTSLKTKAGKGGQPESNAPEAGRGGTPPSSLSTLSTTSLKTEVGKGGQDNRRWEPDSRSRAWMESAADAWLVRTQERLKAHDDPALPGRTPRHALLVSPEDAAQDTRMAEIVHWLLDENWEPVDSASPMKLAA